MARADRHRRRRRRAPNIQHRFQRAAADDLRGRSPRLTEGAAAASGRAAPLLAALVLADQRLALAGEDADVAADRDEVEAGVERHADLVVAAAEIPGRLAGLLDPRAALEDGLVHLRVLQLAEMAHARREV